MFSIDVEDWFHIMDLPTAPRIESWGQLPSRVGHNFHTLLDMLDIHEVKATCFFLGWVAEKHPELVREAMNRGHEIASHGYEHELVYKMTAEAFRADITRAKSLLENITGSPIYGYRAPGFSVDSRVPWFFDEVARTGYRYDSSVFPTTRQHGGYPGFDLAPKNVRTRFGTLIEFPISVVNVVMRRLCFFGGGYLRMFPYAVIKHMALRVLKDKRPVIFYIHPREIDPQHPRLKMPAVRRLKSYIGLASTAGKIDRILSEFRFKPFKEMMEDMEG